MIRQLSVALEYMHKLDIFHMKLRLENIYLQNVPLLLLQNVVKLSGFGHSQHLPLLRTSTISSFWLQKGHG